MLAVGGLEKGAGAEKGPSSTSPSQDKALLRGSLVIGKGSSLTLLFYSSYKKIKQVNFTLYESRISFDANGNIRKGYAIVIWNWNGPSRAFSAIGTFSVNPDRLSIDQGKILWHTKDRQAPTSVCSKACQPGENRLQRSCHRCRFSCVACPSGTFLNKSGQYAPGGLLSPLPSHLAPLLTPCLLLPSAPCFHLAIPQPLPSQSLFLPVVSKNL
ncbi:LOW QUALITY PROTEIN: taste receptor type 1 member 1-like [Spheniscus humboldti]